MKMSTGNLHGNKTFDSCNGWRNSEIFKQCHLQKQQQKKQKEKTQRKQQNTPEAPLVTAVLYRVAFALLFV